jgi:multisubunit Na+/H+ antiporter MnhG subunit
VAPELVVIVFTSLSALVVVLTRLRLARAPAGQTQLGRGTVNTHTACGVLALALWVPFLMTGHDSSLVGVLGLLFYWLMAAVGLLLLWRWKPSRGRHAASAGPTDRSWSEGPGLSILAHVGMVVGALVFTWYFGTQS